MLCYVDYIYIYMTILIVTILITIMTIMKHVCLLFEGTYASPLAVPRSEHQALAAQAGETQTTWAPRVGFFPSDRQLWGSGAQGSGVYVESALVSKREPQMAVVVKANGIPFGGR